MRKKTVLNFARMDQGKSSMTQDIKNSDLKVRRLLEEISGNVTKDNTVDNRNVEYVLMLKFN